MAESDDEAILRRMTRFKARQIPAAKSLGDEMLAFFKRDVQRRIPKLESLSLAWRQIVPDLFHPHTCLESFTSGTLTVMVDSSSHLYELRRVMLAGTEKKLLAACKSAGLRKVVLKRGTWTDDKGEARF
jgi:hypothetical protein